MLCSLAASLKVSHSLYFYPHRASLILASCKLKLSLPSRELTGAGACATEHPGVQGPPAAVPGQSLLALHHRCFANSAGQLAWQGQPRAGVRACVHVLTQAVGSGLVPRGHPAKLLFNKTETRGTTWGLSSTKVRLLQPCCLSGLREAALKAKAGCCYEAHAGCKLAPFSWCWRREACVIFSLFTSANHCPCHSYTSSSQKQARFLKFLTKWV